MPIALSHFQSLDLNSNPLFTNSVTLDKSLEFLLLSYPYGLRGITALFLPTGKKLDGLYVKRHTHWQEQRRY